MPEIVFTWITSCWHWTSTLSKSDLKTVDEGIWNKYRQKKKTPNTTKCKVIRVLGVPFKNENCNKKSIKKKRPRIHCCIFNMWVSIVSIMMFQLTMIYVQLLRTFFFHDCCVISYYCILTIFQSRFWVCGFVATSHPWCECHWVHAASSGWMLRSFFNKKCWPWEGVCELKLRREALIHKTSFAF